MSRVDPSIYRVKLFSEEGYKRIKCSSCGAYFWSLRDREDCGDAPCSPYTFFDIKLKVPPLSIKEVRDKFLKFFERNGHEVIEPHPVLARWRDDLYLTIASIIVFQPHVTSGIVPPPANPLVIAQPCIRLEDIDSVGYTLGRHLTNFIMGGHHAFNYPNKFIYFTHETVRYARDFFVNELGVPEDELTFKESWWEGGGNAGPCFEVSVGGLEVATLVFMMYECRDGSYVEMPIKIVDTGYGIERIAWLTQKTPTAFHAIYGSLVSDYFKLLELKEPPEDVFRVAIKYLVKVSSNDEAGLRALVKYVSKDLGMDYDEVLNYLSNSIKVFTLLDHVKTALLMLGDGAVPSNTGEGYLVRLVLRRVFRVLTLLGKTDVIYDLIDKQLSYWRDLYPNLSNVRDYVHDVVDHELSKYRDVINRAPKVIRKYVKRGKGLSTDDLIEIYDSHGIPPEVAKEVSKKLGIEVEIPRDFYSRLASKHSRAPLKRKEGIKVPKEVAESVSDLVATELLFHKDPYLRVFEGRVVKVVGDYVVLDKTAFYPEGGGQAPDGGYLILPNGSKVEVVDVQKVGDVVVHRVKGDGVSEGMVVKGVIDWVRRFSLMRHHTATHIILGAARKVLGNHVWQAGAEKRVDVARLDITHYKPLSEEEIRRIEELANSVVDEGLEVRTEVMGKYEAERRYGFRLYQGGVVLAPKIRVVEIEGHDVEACFGTHVRNTREVGGIKIVNVERIADGVIRLEYVAGARLADYARRLESVIKESSKVLGGDVLARSKAVIEEVKGLKELLSNYRRLIRDSLIKELLSNASLVSGVKVIVKGLDIYDPSLVKDVLLKLSRDFSDVVAVVISQLPKGNYSLVEVSVSNELTKKISANDLIKYLSKELGGRGGGKKDHASGRFLGRFDELESRVRDLIIRFVEERVSS